MILIADIVLFFHFFIVVFITFGFVLIPIGYNFNWIWIKNKKLRLLHFGMMIFVTFETILGLSCPLTVLENNLRGINENQLFLSRWITEVIYWDFPSEFFLIIYCLCLGWTFLIWKKYPPIEKND
tara:strand:+ start:219 stop:593 length:375 start_codon:yes stop_codon:yes gene_type:complete